MGHRYATREMVKAAANISGAAEDARVDRLLESHTRDVERDLSRYFYPRIATHYFDWPCAYDELRSTSSQLRSTARDYEITLALDDDLQSITTLKQSAQSTPVSLDGAHYWLSPVNDGPPYIAVIIDGRYITPGTEPRDLALAGVWGFCATSAVAGATAEVLDATETGVDVTDASLIGVGDLVLVDTERMIVTGRSLLDTTATLNGALGDGSDDVLVPVNTGSLLNVGEVITVDAERMFIEDIAGNNLIVSRAYDGTTLAAHLTAVHVYAPRTLTVERGVYGTTAATHLTAAAITRNVPTPMVTELVIAEVIAALAQEQSGYARTVGQGQGSQGLDSAGLENLRTRVRNLYAAATKVAI